MSKVRELRDAGYLYDGTADEPELAAERTKAKDLCFEYNYQTRPSDSKRQGEIMDQLLGKHGKNTAILAPFFCDYGYNIEVGDNFFANHNLCVLDPARCALAITSLSPPTSTSPLPGTPSTLRLVIAALSTPTRSPSAIASGLAPMSAFCPASPSALTS